METLQNTGSTHVPLISEKLNLYFKNKFTEVKKCWRSKKALEEESSHLFWEKYIQNGIAKKNVFWLLKSCFPQLCFPISQGLNESVSYRNATLKGRVEDIFIQNNALQLEDEPGIVFTLYKSFAGDIPVLIIPNENDFTNVIRALLYKNNPVTVPVSMGAAFIKGLNNWQRLRELKAVYLSKNVRGDWDKEFKENILPVPHLYKDNIILLSAKPYSNLPSREVGLDEKAWRALSLKIRLEHECTHLFTSRFYGSASNNLHDELIADYVGLVRSFGRYNKEWMLLFMGLENYPAYRNGARLENYVKGISFDKTEFSALTTIIRKSIENINRFDIDLGRIKSFDDLKARIGTLCRVDLLDIASVEGSALLIDKYLTIE